MAKTKAEAEKPSVEDMSLDLDKSVVTIHAAGWHFQSDNIGWLAGTALVAIHRARFAEAEVERLKRGDFTEEEFQSLCHNLAADDRDRFRRGCEEYQKKLFGCQPQG
jgi:hypothetical protein